jgi:hypothetical protein
MYVRFQRARGGGLFQAARHDLLLSPRLTRDGVRRAQRLRAWLWRHTPVPPRSAYVPPPGIYSTTWFRPDARKHIAAATELARILLDTGVHIRLVWSPDPGRIVHQDSVQIVAWSERRTPYGVSIPYRSSAQSPRPRCRRDRATIRQWGRPCTNPVPDEIWSAAFK